MLQLANIHGYGGDRGENSQHASQGEGKGAVSGRIQEVYQVCCMLRVANIQGYGGNARLSVCHVTDTANTQVSIWPREQCQHMSRSCTKRVPCSDWQLLGVTVETQGKVESTSPTRQTRK
jgi:hypothetical protein